MNQVAVPTINARSVMECLGGPWPTPGNLHPTVHGTQLQKGYRIESVSYEVEPGDRVRGFLLVPEGVDASHPAPAIAVWHQHNGEWHLGKSEPAGRAGNPMHHTGVALAKEGYVVLCPDALCFEERQDPTDGRKRIISFGPRSEESTPDDIGRSVQWIKDFRKNGLPG